MLKGVFASMLATEKNSRMDVRLTALQRRNYERAASLTGQTLTQWATSNLDMCARRDIEEASSTVLSEEAFDEFCKMLDQPLPDEVQSLLARKDIWE